MENTKLFLFNSLSVSFGLFLFTFILYICYKIFYNDKDDNGLSLETVNENSQDLMNDLESLVDEEENNKIEN
jgi:hypothetical protein